MNILKPKGWRREPFRHSLASKGIKTSNCLKAEGVWLEGLSNRYGGLPSFGGYRSYTEYEIGAGHMAEAVHCILGSMQETVEGGEHIHHRYEHIQEELELIEYDLGEYGKETYSGDFVWRDPEYGVKSLESMKTNSPKLKERAETMKSLAESDESISEEDRRVLVLCYDFVIRLASNVEESVRDLETPPVPYERNAYRDRELWRIYGDLRDAVEDAFPEEAKR